MTRIEALDSVEIEYDTEGYEVPDESMTSFSDMINLISKIYDDFEKEQHRLKKDIEYWKNSYYNLQKGRVDD